MSNNTFIDLHGQMNTKGWIPDWEFNEAVDLYKYNDCLSIADCQSIGKGDYKSDITNGVWIYHLGKLTKGNRMFYDTTIASFSGDLSSLENGNQMFYKTALASFNGDLSSLTDGWRMFQNTTLESFSGDLSNLTYGQSMFRNTNLASFSGDLSSLNISNYMFLNTSLESFSGDLSRLTNGTGMFYNTNLESFSGDLSSLNIGNYMFYNSPLESFSGDLSSLTNSQSMFRTTALTSFNGDLPSLTVSNHMFYNSPLESFSGDLSNLIYGQNMFRNSALTSFNGDLPSLTYGHAMFYRSALESFNGDLSSLTDGSHMFCPTHARNYTIKHYKMVDGVKQKVETSVTSTGFKSFNSNLSSLTNGYYMFGGSASSASPLSEESIMNIADTIQDINSLELTGNAGQLWLGYDTTITDTTNIMNCCDRIAAKGWTVYLNGSQYISSDSGSAALIDGESSTTPIPHYYKPVQVTDEEIGEYVDSNGNFYIIVGGQHVFGDDISTYGMFTSYEHAIEQISLGLGLTPCEKPNEEEIL